MQVKLYTYLKNTDLHAVSAQEAIRQLLHVKNLSALRRYGCWTLEIENEQALETILRCTYYLVNPNKEAYFINTLPKPAGQNDVVLVTVEKKEAQAFDNIEAQIQQKSGLACKILSHNQVWECHFQEGSYDEAEFLKRVVNTQSRSEGLLAHPLYETPIVSRHA